MVCLSCCEPGPQARLVFLAEELLSDGDGTILGPSGHWILDLLNFKPEDELIDLYPGTGVMSVAVDERRSQISQGAANV